MLTPFLSLRLWIFSSLFHVERGWRTQCIEATKTKTLKTNSLSIYANDVLFCKRSKKKYAQASYEARVTLGFYFRLGWMRIPLSLDWFRSHAADLKRARTINLNFWSFAERGKENLSLMGGGLIPKARVMFLTAVNKWRILRESGSFHKDGKQFKERLETTLWSVGIVFLRAIAMAL